MIKIPASHAKSVNATTAWLSSALGRNRSRKGNLAAGDWTIPCPCIIAKQQNTGGLRHHWSQESRWRRISIYAPPATSQYLSPQEKQSGPSRTPAYSLVRWIRRGRERQAHCGRTEGKDSPWLWDNSSLFFLSLSLFQFANRVNLPHFPWGDKCKIDIFNPNKLSLRKGDSVPRNVTADFIRSIYIDVSDHNLKLRWRSNAERLLKLLFCLVSFHFRHMGHPTRLFKTYFVSFPVIINSTNFYCF